MKKAILFSLVAFATLTTTIATAEIVPAPTPKEKLNESTFLAYNEYSQPAFVSVREYGFKFYLSLMVDKVQYCIGTNSVIILKLADGKEVTLKNINPTDCSISAMYVANIDQDAIKKLKASPVKSVTAIADDGPLHFKEKVDAEFFRNCFKE